METFDVVVLGTGAAALTAAIRAHDGGAQRRACSRRPTQVGGTSAWSGGMVWIPVNPHMAELGIEDSREEALTYLHSLSHGLIDEDLAAALVDAGPEMVTLVRGEHAGQVPDHQGLPGLPPRAPGREARRRPVARVPAVPVRRSRRLAGPGDGRSAAVGQHHDERDEPRPRRARAGSRRPNWSGGASATNAAPGKDSSAPLLRACLDRSIEPRTGMRAVELIVDDGRVVGRPLRDQPTVQSRSARAAA